MDIIDAVRARIPVHLAQRRALSLSVADYHSLVDALYRLAAAEKECPIGVIFQTMNKQMRAQLPPSVLCLVYDNTSVGPAGQIQPVPLEVAHNYIGSIVDDPKKSEVSL